MASGLYALCDEQMTEVLEFASRPFFAMVVLSIKKRFSHAQIKSQLLGVVRAPDSDCVCDRLMVAIESFFRMWVMNDFTIGPGAETRKVAHSSNRRMPHAAIIPMHNGRWQRENIRPKLEKDNKIERSDHVTLRSTWSSSTLTALDVGIVVCTCENFCLVQGPFSQRILTVDEIRVVKSNRSPLCTSAESARASLSQSNVVSALTSLVTQRCLLQLPVKLKLHIGAHIQALAETCFSTLVLSCGLDASRCGIKLAEEVQLFESQVVEMALTSALKIATDALSSVAFSSCILCPSSAKIFTLSRLLYALDYLDWQEFHGPQNHLVDVLNGLQIIKKFMFQQLSWVSRLCFTSISGTFFCVIISYTFFRNSTPIQAIWFFS
jgi:hypothetical protein